jgi:hypothetical protein
LVKEFRRGSLVLDVEPQAQRDLAVRRDGELIVAGRFCPRRRTVDGFLPTIHDILVKGVFNI